MSVNPNSAETSAEPNATPEQSFAPEYAHFVVQACADPATLIRVVEYFALNNILPDLVRSRCFVDGDLVIDIKVRGLEDQRAAVILQKLRASVLVINVTLEWVHKDTISPNLRLVS